MVSNNWAAIQPATNSNYGAATVPLWVSLQQFPQFGNGSYGAGNGVIVDGYPGGDSDYNSLQTKVQKRLTRHFTALASFTWAKLMTDDGNPPLGFVGTHGGAAQDSKNLSFEHSVSPQDVKYQFTGEASYDLPVGKGRAVNLNGVGDAILGGWTGNIIAYLSTGIPVASPVSGVSPSYFNQRADMVCNPSKGAPHTATTWFNASCFTMPGVPVGSTDTSTPIRWSPEPRLRISTTSAPWVRRTSICRSTRTSRSAANGLFASKSPPTTLRTRRNWECRVCRVCSRWRHSPTLQQSSA